MSFLGTFNPSDLVLSFNNFVITDYADGSFVEIIPNSKPFRQARGIRGKHTRVHNRDKSGTIVFRLMQTSDQNEVLSKLSLEDDINMTGLLFVTIRDTSGQSGFQFINAYLEGNPQVTYQAGSTVPREWRVFYDSYSLYNLSGNRTPPIEIPSGIF